MNRWSIPLPHWTDITVLSILILGGVLLAWLF